MVYNIITIDHAMHSTLNKYYIQQKQLFEYICTDFTFLLPFHIYIYTVYSYIQIHTFIINKFTIYYGYCNYNKERIVILIVILDKTLIE